MGLAVVPKRKAGIRMVAKARLLRSRAWGREVSAVSRPYCTQLAVRRMLHLRVAVSERPRPNAGASQCRTAPGPLPSSADSGR